MAECSRVHRHDLRAVALRGLGITSSPAQTRVSLLARAMRLPCADGGQGGLQPDHTHHSGEHRVRRRAGWRPPTGPSVPEATRMPVSASRTRRSAAAASSQHHGQLGLKLPAPGPPSASTSAVGGQRGHTTCRRRQSHPEICRPMEPVEPSKDNALSHMVLHLVLHGPMSSSGTIRVTDSISGAQKITLSNRSSTPPWPGTDGRSP